MVIEFICVRVAREVLKALKAGSDYHFEFDAEGEADDVLLELVFQGGKWLIKKAGPERVAIGVLTVAMLPLAAPFALLHSIAGSSEGSPVSLNDEPVEGVFDDYPYHGMLEW